MRVNLANVTGTGYKGRIHLDDVAGWNFKGKTHVSPLARRIAEAHGVNLDGLKGSGHNNKVLKEDVIQLIDNPEVKAELSRDYMAEAMAAPVPSPTPKSPEYGDENPQQDTKEKSVSERVIPSEGDTETIPMTMMRKVIAKRMMESYFGIPSFIQTWEIDMTELLALRAKMIDPIKERTDKKITVTDLISFAVIRALKKHKYINASLNKEGSEITFHNYVSLGMAVGLDEGLLVPVVKHADKLSLSELVVALKDVTERTISKKLTPDDQTGSTFTISNLGMYGVDNFTAIINQPNAAILSVASTQQKMVVRDGEAVIRPIMNISLTCDHRIIDGLTAAKFMTDLKQLMENPLSLLI